MSRNSLRWVIVVIWLLLIGYCSAQPFQKQDVSPYIAAHPRMVNLVQEMPLVEFHYADYLVNNHTKTVPFIQFLIRKLMHITFYGLFGLSLLAALPARGRKGPISWLIAAFLVLGVASLDEFNQYLSTTRTGCREDVAMDLFGFILFSSLMFIIKRRRNRV